MSGRIHLALFAVFAGALAFFCLFDLESMSGTPEYREDEIAALELAQTASLDTLPQSSERATLETPKPRARASNPGILVRATWSTGKPAPNIWIALTRWGSRDAMLSRLRTNADGLARFPDCASGRYGVVTDRGTTQVANHRHGRTTGVIVRLSGNSNLRGRVVDAAGLAVADASILLAGAECTGALEVARSGPDGRFSIAGLPAQSQLWAAHKRYAPSTSQRTPRQANANSSPIELRLGAGSTALRVTVQDEQGQPIRAWAALRYASQTEGSRVEQTFRQLPSAEPHLFDGLRSNPVILTVGAKGFAVFESKLALPPQGIRAMDVKLNIGGEIQGVVRSADGEPLVAASVALSSSSSTAHAHTDRSGSFRIAHAPAGRATLVVKDATGSVSQDVQVRVGEVHRVELQLGAGIHVSGRYLDSRNRPIAGMRVTIQPSIGGEAAVRETRTNAKGLFQFAHCNAAAHRIHAWAIPNSSMPSRSDRIQPGEPIGDLVIHDHARKPGRISGRVLGATRAPQDATITLHSERLPDVGLVAGSLAESGGSFTISELPAGEYLIHACVAGGQEFFHGKVTVRAGETTDIGTIVEQATGSVEITPGSQIGDDAQVTLLAGHVAIQLQRKGEKFVASGIPPGRYRIQTLGWIAPIAQTVLVTPAAEVTVQGNRPAAHEARLLMRGPARKALRTLVVEIRDGASAQILSRLEWTERALAVTPLSLLLHPGSYTAHITSSDGLRCTSSFQIHNRASKHEFLLY